MKFDGGVLTANLTSFRPDFSVDWDNMAGLARELAARPGIRGFVVNAFAGEGPTLTNAERIRVIEVHRKSASPDQPVVASVLDTSTAGAIRQAVEAKDAGADGILICPPIVSSWNAAASPQIAITYHKAIAEAVDLPIILFQLAVGDPVAYGNDLLLKLIQDIPSVVAVKMAQANDAVRYDQDFLSIKKLDRPIACLPAVGSSMFHNLMTGGDGLLTGLVNLFPEDVTGLFLAIQSGDVKRARDIHVRLAHINHFIYDKPYVDLHTRYKEAAYMLGVVSSPEVRGPQIRLSQVERDKLRSLLIDAGYL